MVKKTKKKDNLSGAMDSLKNLESDKSDKSPPNLREKPLQEQTKAALDFFYPLPKKKKKKRKRLPVDLDPDYLDQLKDVAVFLNITLNQLVVDAMDNHLKKLIRKNGGPFPPRKKRELRRGKRLE